MIHDDLHHKNTWIEDTPNGVCVIDHLELEDEPGVYSEWIKVLRLCKIENIPREFRERRSLMNIQSDILSALWERKTQFVTVYANILEPVQRGLLYCYGIQIMVPVSGEGADGSPSHLAAIELAKHRAIEQSEQDMAGLLGLLEGSYRQCWFRELNRIEMSDLYNTMMDASNLQILRGIPKTHISSGLGTNDSLLGTLNTPDALEQCEEFIRSLLTKQFAFLMLATPIDYKELVRESYRIAGEYGRIKSGIQGSVAHNIGFSFPISIAGNVNVGLGYNSGFSDTEGTNMGAAYGQSANTTHTVGDTDTTSHQIGTSHTQNTGTADSVNESMSNTRSLGRSQTDTEGDSYGTGHTIGKSQTHTEGSGQTDTVSSTSTRGVGLTNTIGANWGTSLTNTHSEGFSEGMAYGTSTSHSMAYGSNQNWGQNNNWGQNTGTAFSQGTGTSNTFSQSQGTADSTTYTTGNTHTDSHSSTEGTTGGWAETSGSTVSTGTSTTTGNNYSNGGSHTSGTSVNVSGSFGRVVDVGGGFNNSNGTNWSKGASDSWGVTDATSNSSNSTQSGGWNSSTTTGASNAVSTSTSTGHTDSTSTSTAVGTSTNQSNTMSKGNSVGGGNSYSHGNSQTESFGTGTSQTKSASTNTSDSQAHGSNQGNSRAQAVAQTASYSHGVSHANSRTSSDAIGLSESLSESRNKSFSHANGNTQTVALGNSLGAGRTISAGLANGLSESTGDSHANSQSLARGTGTSTTFNEGISNAKGRTEGSSNTYASGMGANMGFGPSIGYSKVQQTFDARKELLAGFLEEQTRRYRMATTVGAFYVDIFMMAKDDDTAAVMAYNARSAFGGDTNLSTIQVVTPADRLTQTHLHNHACCCIPCNEWEVIPRIAEGYKYSTILLPGEVAALSHLPRVEGGATFTVSDNIPAFTVDAQKSQGDIYLGKQVNHENGRDFFDFYFDAEKHFMHTLISGASGSGKTTTAIRMAEQVIKKKKDLKVTILDWKEDWRAVYRFAEPGDFDIWSLHAQGVKPIHMNVYVPPKYIPILTWRDKVNECLCLAYGLGNKMYSILNQITTELFEERGVISNGPEGPRETPAARTLVTKVTLADVYQKLFNKKEKLGPRSSMVDTYESMLAKLYNYAAGEQRALYCETNENKIVRIEDIINGPRITVLEGGEVDEMTKKFIISLLSHGIFSYCKARKMREGTVEKRFFVLEEAHRVVVDTTKQNNPLQVSEDIFQIMWNEARGYGLYLMAICQTPSHLPANVIANSSILITHRLSLKDDVEQMTLSLARNAKLDHRDVPLFIEKMPIGWSIVRVNNQERHQYSEPILVKVSGLNTSQPKDIQLVLDLNLSLPEHLKESPYYAVGSFAREYLDEMG